MGRTLVLIGAGFILLGLLVMLGERTPIRFGRLPGDIVWRGRNSTVYFPLATSILLSVILTLVMWLINRRR